MSACVTVCTRVSAPAGASLAGQWLLYSVPRPTSKWYVAGPPFGLTSALRVALVWPTAVAAPVVTSGGGGNVVNRRSALRLVPLLFVATIQK